VLQESPTAPAPFMQAVRFIDIEHAVRTIEEENTIALALTPTNWAPNLCDLLNATGAVSMSTLIHTAVALDLSPLVVDENIIAIIVVPGILGNMLDTVSPGRQASHHSSLSLLSDAQCFLSLNRIPIRHV